MSRLIDADALLKYKSDHETISTHLIYNAPTIDAVLAIRCKNCKWFGGIGCAIRIADYTDKPSENDYCSFAERKEENGK